MTSNLLADIREHGVIWTAKKHGIPKSTLYYRVKRLGKEEEIEQEIWEFKKAHPKSTNTQIKEKLKIHFSITKIFRIINDFWIKEFPLWETKYGSLERMINDPKARAFLLMKPRFRKEIERFVDHKKKLFRQRILLQPGRSRTTVWSILKEFHSYLLAKNGLKDKRGLLLQLPQYNPNMDEVDIRDRIQNLIRYRYYLMKKIDDFCLKNGIDLRSMVGDRNKLLDAALIIYWVKKCFKEKRNPDEALLLYKLASRISSNEKSQSVT